MYLHSPVPTTTTADHRELLLYHTDSSAAVRIRYTVIHSLVRNSAGRVASDTQPLALVAENSFTSSGFWKPIQRASSSGARERATMDPESRPLRGPGKAPASGHLKTTQEEVDEVADIMKNNLIGIMERGENLEVLEEKATHLSTAAAQFEKSACRLKKKYWWENRKLKIIIGTTVVLVIAIIVIVVVAVIFA
ncbi:vesicle-associated membrane protein 2-like [Macrobrachium rosenbergii]|uniref:vesicle-associated membrane protein 2-like n=1 Tax=Macrobrachium rosenbergii TaxID=79674 RepID=UPI0034D6579A